MAVADETGGVVLDVGHFSTKAGYAGDDVPRCVLPSVRWTVIAAAACELIDVGLADDGDLGGARAGWRHRDGRAVIPCSVCGFRVVLVTCRRAEQGQAPVCDRGLGAVVASCWRRPGLPNARWPRGGLGGTGGYVVSISCGASHGPPDYAAPGGGAHPASTGTKRPTHAWQVLGLTCDLLNLCLRSPSASEWWSSCSSPCKCPRRTWPRPARVPPLARALRPQPSSTSGMNTHEYVETSCVLHECGTVECVRPSTITSG